QGIESCVVVGANEIGKRLTSVINSEDVDRSRVVAYFDDRSAERVGDTGGVPLAGGLAQLGGWVKANRIHAIYIALPMASQPRILKLLDDLRDTTASIYFAPDIFMYDLI